VRANEKQAVCTGKKQRDGVAVLPFLIAGLFGPLGDEDAADAFALEHEAERAAAAASTDDAGYEADADDNAAAKVGNNFVFDWAAYHDAWGTTFVHVAVTSMFAEYSVLYARIAGGTTSATPPPMTMDEGAAIGEHAKNFVNNFVTPILGHIASMKIHKLLCHVADAIKWHGNINSGNTAANESEHKADKPFYSRTNKDARTFTRQLVRHAHGARTILAHHAEEDKAAVAAWQATLAQRAATAAAAAAAQEPPAAGCGPAAAAAASLVAGDESPPRGGTAAASVMAAPIAIDAEAEPLRKQKKRVYNSALVSVADLASRPDMSNIGGLLNMASIRHVRVTTRTPIQARFDCGTRVQ